jgi:hypothetical protein
MTTFHKFEVIANKKFDSTLAINRVYDLHKAVEGPHDHLVCYHCSSFSTRHFVNYPCFTIVAIEGQESD